MKEKKINYQFLLLQAIAIILVVIGHKGGLGFKTLDNWFPIYAYHMPLFIFISGYFFSLDNLNNILDYIRQKAKHFIIPYLIYNVIYGIILYFFKEKAGIMFGEYISIRTIFAEPWLGGGQFILNLAMWFVLTLFLVQTVYISLRYFCKKIRFQNETLLFLILLILGILIIKATETLQLNGFLHLTCGKVLFFLPFFHFGFCWKQYLEKYDNLNTISTVVYFILLVSVIELSKIFASQHIGYAFAANMAFGGNTFIPYITAFAGILMWLRITKILVKYIGKSKIVEYIGNSTYDIMAHHLFVFFLINFAFYVINYSGFDTQQFKENIWYTFIPNGASYLIYIYYLLAIFIPIGIHYLLKKDKKRQY
ncbi:MAG: acyltransferase family protein [Bacteroidales bacterium]|jgi:fucose 4-O-acetylase-like acetyltransferase|nr:acyltransferase family protein [Bacteroidales bacterium]